ncbi:LptF/LptG family permease [Mangrovimonas cancribranchiae]|uniref:LptF/LptG family permease n=2 Tax=Mangrovimonas cancribranchiae TaxID=3080055 RepID=A0AAU6P9Q2_9FLAO
MKILDRYILTSYLKTFISVLVILLMIFVLQAVWLYIKELAGKDLDVMVIAKFLIYVIPELMPLVLPLTILLTSIMVFGNFAENYEFAAMKSTGISLQRSMRSLGVFIVLLAITTFFFSNNVIPWAKYNSYNLRKNIAKLKPAMVIAEGQFNEVGDQYNIKVAKKSGDRGQFLEEVIIHKKTANKTGNYTTIIAKNGELSGNEESDVLKLILFDGYFYDDTPPKDYKDRQKRPMTKSYFKKYTINVDLSNLNNVDLDQKNVSDKYDMQSIKDLNYSIDSLKVAQENAFKTHAKNLYTRTNFPIINAGVNVKKKDTLYKDNLLSLFNTRQKAQLVNLSLNTFKSTKQIVQSKEKNFKNSQIWLNKHIIALHEKLALGFACIILFFVGAPLGALIRKGGLGLPMVIAILLFLTYHFIGIFAKESSETGSINPALSPWISTLIMFPLSIYLTKRATEDRGLFEFDHLLEPLKKLFKIKSKDDEERKEMPDVVAEIIEEKEPKTPKLSLKNKQLVFKLQDDYNVYAKFSLIFWICGAVFVPLYFILKNNKLPEIALICIQLGVISLFIYLIYYVISYIKLIKLDRLVPSETGLSKNLILIILGLVLYPFTYLLRKNKLNNDISDSLK